MQYEPGIVVENREYGPGHWVVRLEMQSELPSIRAGQFANLRCDPHDMFSLMRPFSIMDFDAASRRIDMYYKHLGRLSRVLSDVPMGAKLDVLYPLGVHFPYEAKWNRVALVGGGVGIAPLILMAKELLVLMDAPEVVLYLGGAGSDDLVPQMLAEYPFEFVFATMDGSEGYKGTVVDRYMQDADEFDAVYTCGPNPMMHALQRVLPAETPAFASLEEYMACAVGACLGCTARIREGENITNKTVCKAGPVFDLQSIVFD